jgi:DNA modification methylase
VLKPTGSFYLHCDPTSSHYLKLVLDAVFCSQGGDFQNEIAWHYSGWNKINLTKFMSRHDCILFYSKGSQPVFFGYSTPYSSKEEYLTTRKQRLYIDESNREYTLDTRNGGKRQVKVYLDEALTRGKPVDDVWNIDKINNSSKERLGYPTQKPETLLERIIKASTNEGDLVLDAYCGCGTTIAVAERLKRNWIGMDITYQSISLVLRRLEAALGKEALANITINGIPQDIASAQALALKQDDRVRKEFEKWAVLTYTNNRAIINDKKGGDRGIDGTAYFLTGRDENAKIVFQVKSGNVGRGDVSKLNNDRTREGAELAVFLTLQPPTQGMKTEASAAGIYEHSLMNRSYSRIQIVNISEIVEQHKRLDIPMSLEVLKKAQAAASLEVQAELFTG